MSYKKISYTTETCSRCGGSGNYSYCQRYGTTCFKCHGKGTQLDRLGKAARKRVEEWKTENCTRTAAELVAGDQVWSVSPTMDGGTVGQWVRFTGEISESPTSWSTIAGVTTESYSVFFETKGDYRMDYGSRELFRIRPVGAAFQELAEFAKRFKGAELVEA